MFTPPSSPLSPKRAHPALEPESEHSNRSKLHSCPPLTPPPPLPPIKGETVRRTKWTVVLFPVALIIIMLSTRYFARPRSIDHISSNLSALDWQSWRPHRQVHQKHRRATSTTLVLPTASSSSPAVPQTLPPIPSATPILPTPFPQAFDTSLTRNFSAQSCYDFFTNMTSTLPFRSCRPFSLLLQSSEAFITAQGNVTELNDIIWGTCNTDPGQHQCNDNMAWFTSSLKTECAEDLKDNNALAVSTLEGLQAFPVMATAACLPDQSTNTYCYIEAVVNTNPSDLLDRKSVV